MAYTTIYPITASNWSSYQLLSANTDFFVSASYGSDANNGLTSTTPWASIQVAIDTITSNYIIQSGVSASINLGAGNYILTASLSPKAFIGAGSTINPGKSISIIGVPGDPTKVILIASGSAGVTCVTALEGIRGYAFDTFTCSGSGTGCIGIAALNGAQIMVRNVNFAGGLNTDHMVAKDLANIENRSTAYTVSSGSSAHIETLRQGSIVFTVANTITFSASCSFTAYASATKAGFLEQQSGATTWVNAERVTGTKWIASGNSVVSSNGGNVAAYPGNVSGSATTGGQYI